MSYTATRNPLSVRRSQVETLERAFLDEGVWIERGILLKDGCPWQLNEEEIEEISEMTEEKLSEWEFGKSWGAVWMARRLRRLNGYEYVNGNYQKKALPSLPSLQSDLAAYRDCARWIRENSDAVTGTGLDASRCLDEDLRFGWEIERFSRLYKEVCEPTRPWGSCYQPSRNKVKAIAFTPNFNRLPLWVKRQMINAHEPIHVDRPGDIWKFIPAAKAWKWTPGLPKKLAVRVGKMSLKARMVAAIAWRLSLPYQGADWKRMDRQEVEDCFWAWMQELLTMPLAKVLELAYDSGDSHVFENTTHLKVVIEHYLGLPNGFVKLPKYPALNDCMDAIAVHGSAEQVCLNLYGVTGKGTVRAFSASSSAQARRWAMDLAYGKPDLLQKYFALGSAVPYEEETVEFLKTLGDRAALRMIATTTYKVRGEEKAVEAFMVKDTGYLYNQIQDKPDTGRVRCWLTIHEDLARSFIAEQPDEVLPVNSRWRTVDGLESVDRLWAIVLPKATNDLKLWGQLLSHCVGGYAPAIKSGRSIIFAVMIDGRVQYTVEMCPTSNAWSCNQFKGLRNCEAPVELKKDILRELAKAKLH